MIPRVVYRELFGKIGIESERIDRALNDFIRVIDLEPLSPTLKETLADLDVGEKQAIGLASTYSSDIILLLDDHAGRVVAEKLNIPTTGTIGILLLAKEKNILKNISSLIDELRYQGYWISDEIADLAKSLAKEK